VSSHFLHLVRIEFFVREDGARLLEDKLDRQLGHAAALRQLEHGRQARRQLVEGIRLGLKKKICYKN
jgi:hypothetical protein